MDRQSSVITWHVVPHQIYQVPRDGLDEQGLRPRVTPAIKIIPHWFSCQGSSAGSCAERHEHTRSCRHQRALGSHQATQDVLSWSLVEGAPRRTHAAPFRAFQEAYVLPTRGSRRLCVPASSGCITSTPSVNLKSQQMEAKGCSAGRRKKVDTDQD